MLLQHEHLTSPSVDLGLQSAPVPAESHISEQIANNTLQEDEGQEEGNNDRSSIGMVQDGVAGEDHAPQHAQISAQQPSSGVEQNDPLHEKKRKREDSEISEQKKQKVQE